MSTCGTCVKNIKSSQLKLVCNDCNGEFHASCLKMSKADVECITSDGLVWRCLPCNSSRRKSMRFESEATGGKLTLEDIMKAIMDLKEDQKSSEVSFNKSFEDMNSRLEDSTNAVRQQSEKFDKYLKIIEDLVVENKSLQKKVVELENRLDHLEQYSRINTLEIKGIPQVPNEDVFGVVAEVGKALNMTISTSMIDACHRLRKSEDYDGPPGIIVKFVRRGDKEEMLQKCRVKKNLSTRHMNRSDDIPVYINESLAPARRRLFAQARQLKKEKDYKYVWLRSGKIFFRKADEAKVITVTCQADFSKL